MTRVHVITPTRAELRLELAQFREWLAARERRCDLVLGFSEAQPIANNRNLIVRKFLNDVEADFLLTIDSDTVPTFNPIDYVARDLDVLGFPYPTFRANDDDPIRWFPGPPDGRGLVEVEAVGGGCLLIARRVLEHPQMSAPFLDYFDDWGYRAEPEDISFCRRARGAGFAVWCDMGAVCGHFKEVEMVTLWSKLGGNHDRETGNSARVPEGEREREPSPVSQAV